MVVGVIAHLELPICSLSHQLACPPVGQGGVYPAHHGQQWPAHSRCSVNICRVKGFEQVWSLEHKGSKCGLEGVRGAGGGALGAEGSWGIRLVLQGRSC